MNTGKTYTIVIPSQDDYVPHAKKEGGVSAATARENYATMMNCIIFETNRGIYTSGTYELPLQSLLDIHAAIMEVNPICAPEDHFIKALIRAGLEGPEEVFPGLKEIRKTLTNTPNAEFIVPHWPFLDHDQPAEKIEPIFL